MSWFSKKEKREEQPDTQPSNKEEECKCTSDSLIYEAIFGRDYSYRSISSVFACVELISNALSSMPLRLVHVDEHGHREVVAHHPLQRIFRNKNIQTMSIQQTMKSAIQDVLMHGNGYIIVKKNEAGIITALRYVKAGAVSVQYDDYKDILYYIVTIDDDHKALKYKPEEVIHFTKTTTDGVNGRSVVSFAKKAIDLAMSAEDAAKQYFDSNMNVSGLLSCKTMMNEKQRQDIKNSWTAGRGKNTLQILPIGVDYVQLGTDAKSGMLLESRQHETTDIARFFGVPVQLIQSGEKLTYNSLEQLNLLFYQHTLQPYICMIESEFTRKLFYDDDFLEVDMDESEFLLRTDKASTANYLKTLVDSGILTVNEARLELGLSEVEDGDKLHIAYSDASKAQIGAGNPNLNNEQ